MSVVVRNTSLRQWLNTSRLLKGFDDEELSEFGFSHIPHMTQELFDILDTLLHGGKLVMLSPEQIVGALHIANFLNSDFLLYAILKPFIRQLGWKPPYYGPIDYLPEFVPQHILKEKQLYKLWNKVFIKCFATNTSSDNWEKNLNRLYNEQLFWKCPMDIKKQQEGVFSVWHELFIHMECPTHALLNIPHKQLQWMRKRGFLHLLQLFPIDTAFCPIRRLLRESYQYMHCPKDHLSLFESINVPNWLIDFLDIVPDYLTTPDNEGRTIAEILVSSNQIKLLDACLPYIRMECPTQDGGYLIDASINHHGVQGAFGILAQHNYLPSEQIWRSVIFKATHMRHFITDEIHYLTSTPDVPLMPESTVVELNIIIIALHHSDYRPNTRQILNQLQYIYNWNREKKRALYS